VRRGAADRRRSDGTVAWWWVAVSRAGGGLTAEPSWLRSAACAAPTGTRFGVQQAVGSSWRPRCPDACRGLVALSASSVSVHASGVRCPVSARAMSARPVSNVPRCPASVSGCPLSGVSSVGVRAFRVPVRVRCVRTGDLVERVGASGSHTARAMVWPPCRTRERLGQPLRARAGPLRRRRPCWASGDVGPDLVVVVEALGQRTGFDHTAGQGPPVAQDRPSVWEQVCALCTPSCGMAAHRPSGAGLAACGRP
jgi:hypothetical protein